MRVFCFARKRWPAVVQFEFCVFNICGVIPEQSRSSGEARNLARIASVTREIPRPTCESAGFGMTPQEDEIASPIKSEQQLQKLRRFADLSRGMGE